MAGTASFGSELFSIAAGNRCDFTHPEFKVHVLCWRLCSACLSHVGRLKLPIRSVPRRFQPPAGGREAELWSVDCEMPGWADFHVEPETELLLIVGRGAVPGHPKNWATEPRWAPRVILIFGGNCSSTTLLRGFLSLPKTQSVPSLSVQNPQHKSSAPLWQIRHCASP